MQIEISRLHLLSPLYFTPEKDADPFSFRERGPDGEKIFCFELEETQYRSFEPEKAKFFGSRIMDEKVLPQGDYLFAQKREILKREEIMNLAVEMQQEALWQRLEPEKKLYLRYLFEDGSWVTQLFRPYR